jgi:hypothetical protein
MGVKAFTWGDTLTAAEAAHVIDVMLPKGTSARVRAAPIPVILTRLHAAQPNFLDHLVNKMRGVAFDSGEDGFSHSVITTTGELK